MDNVVAIRAHLARPEMVEATSELLERMKQGEELGIMYFTAGATGEDSWAVHGKFADDLQYAIYSLTKMLNALVTKSATEGTLPSRRQVQELPRMLRLGVR